MTLEELIDNLSLQFNEHTWPELHWVVDPSFTVAIAKYKNTQIRFTVRDGLLQVDYGWANQQTEKRSYPLSYETFHRVSNEIATWFNVRKLVRS